MLVSGCVFLYQKSSCNVAFLQATPILVSKVLMGQEKTGRKDRGSSGIYDKIMKTTHITTRWAQKPIINGVITPLIGFFQMQLFVCLWSTIGCHVSPSRCKGSNKSLAQMDMFHDSGSIFSTIFLSWLQTYWYCIRQNPIIHQPGKPFRKTLKNNRNLIEATESQR